MLGTPFTAGTLSSAASSATYSVPVSTPVPPGAAVTVFAGASGATAATGVTDSQGNTYALKSSSTSNEYLQAFTATAVTGLNPLAGDTWTVTYGAANTQEKTVIAVAVTGASATDIATAANGSGTAMSATGSAADGNEVILACYQNANAGAAPSALSLTSLTTLSPSGQQYMTAAYGYLTSDGSVTATGTIASAAWAVALVSLTASAPSALGTGSSPSGGATLPPYPVLPSPRTWSPENQLLAPLLRADPGNAITLLANPPLYIGGQTTTVQSVPTATGTPVDLDTDLADPWASHAIPNPTLAPPLAGWYLAEGLVNFTDTSTSSVMVAGIQATQNGVQNRADSAKVVNNGVNNSLPNACDLVQVNPATQDTIALYCAQDSGATKTIASAYLKTEWVCASAGTVVSSPVPAAGWTSGATTLLDSVTAGATSAVMADPTGIVTGGTIQLDYGNAVAESVTVTSVSGQTIGFTACAYPHAADAPVSVPVSAAFMNQQVRDKINFLAYRPVARLTSQGSTQGTLPSQTWPAGTAIQWVNPATAGTGCTDNFTGWASGNPTRYTFPVSGTWFLYGQVYLADTTASYVASAGLAISGGTIMWGDRQKTAGSSSETICATVRRVLRVTGGQYAEVYGSQNSGAARTISVSASQHCRMIAIWRGF